MDILISIICRKSPTSYLNSRRLTAFGCGYVLTCFIRSPVLTHIDTGLRRIRQVPTARLLTSPSTHDIHSGPPSAAPSRKSSMNVAQPPASPGLHFSDNLSRFPSESLHSFSFAHQTSETLQTRQNALKRSLDFVRDKLGWAASSPRIASAQARLNGDEELLTIMELLQQANVMGGDGAQDAGIGINAGALTGPAHLNDDNVFEKSFDHLVDSPESASPVDATPQAESQPKVMHPPQITIAQEHSAPVSRSEVDSPDDGGKEQLGRPINRAALKRTYTDISGLSLQQRLSEAMSQPYHAQKTSSSFHPQHPPTITQAQPTNRGASIERAPHGYRNHPQAIFTTEDRAPWTITAANDLACLIFGVTRAEVRKLGIMEVIKEERRRWLEDKLRNPDTGSTQQRMAREPPAESTVSNTIPSAMGRGLTAKLLSKPPSRETYKKKPRSKTENGVSSSSSATSRSTTPHHTSRLSRGVLLCGDVIPIKKRNGDYGSASLWVKEKSGGLIWVLEEIAESVAYLEVDEIGSVIRGSGDIDPIWAIDRVRSGMDVQKLIPSFPKLAGTYTGAVDYDAINRLRGFTARTANSISVPITIQQLSGESNFRVSSFPHIAGIMVVNPASLCITSSNSVFSAALFGQTNPNGKHITELIPGFDKILSIITDEDKIALQDGIVIPEHSFRRARSLLALREGSADAAALFLKPSGIPARHRDGASIMIDVQMRVVKSDREPIYTETVIEEGEEEGIVDENRSTPENDIVLALWITYSRQLHAVNHGIGPITPFESRPATPPSQPQPTGEIDEAVPTPLAMNANADRAKLDLLPQRMQELKLQAETAAIEAEDPLDTDEPFEHPSPELSATGVKVIQKKKIDDFVILEEMGQGAYGQVKLARYRRAAAKKMVIKYVIKRRILVDTWHRDRRLGTVPLEIHVLDYLRRDGLQHPNIVEMADFFEDDVNYYIEMFPHGLPGMDLFDYIELRVQMEESECRKIFKQVAEALQHLHITAKVVHRDIKDENVILDGEGKVKLVDFGSAAYIKSGPFDVFVGTIDYAAPEVLRGAPYRGKEQDVWALGILLYTIIYKENPFYSIDEIMDHDLRVPWVMSEPSIDLIRKMLDRDVERRIGIQAVLEHEWCTAEDAVEGQDEQEKQDT